MVEVNLKTLVISALLVGIFSFALLSFGNQMSLDNNTKNIILEEEQFNRTFNTINVTLQDATNTINATREGFFSDIPIVGDLGAFLTSIVAVGRQSFSVVKSIYDLTIGLIAETLGISPIVIGVITSIIIIVSLLLAWRVYRTGS